jgi:hypothetical protein
MNSGLSRRGVVAAIAAAFAAPPVHVAVAAPPDTIELARWAERQAAVEHLRSLSAAYDAAAAKLPAWAQPGHRSIDQDGNPCGYVCNWPMDETVLPPTFNAWRVVRPSTWDAKESFDFGVRVFHWTGKHRAAQRAAMQRTVREIIGRLRERDRLRDELGLTELNRQIEATTDATINAEDYFRERGDETPNIVAARLMMGLASDCQQDAIASGHGYCGIMAMALVALRGLLPSLSGMIREHAAFFVDNPGLALRGTPFNAVG